LNFYVSNALAAPLVEFMGLSEPHFMRECSFHRLADNCRTAEKLKKMFKGVKKSCTSQ
jgi:hypothetical protein